MHAADYLLKPIEAIRVEEAVHHLEQRLSEQRARVLRSQEDPMRSRVPASISFALGLTALGFALFRLPLAAIFCVRAGGALAAPKFWATWPRARQLALGGTLVFAAALTFSNFDGVRDRAAADGSGMGPPVARLVHQAA